MGEHRIRFGDVSFDLADPSIDHKPLPREFVDLLHAYAVDTYDTCSYHRKRMDGAGVKPGSVRSLEDWARIPILTSADVSAVSEFRLLPDRYQAQGKQGLGELAPDDRIGRRFSTTGSTGKPKVSYHTVADWSANQASVGRMMSHIPRALFTRIFNCFHAGHAAGKYTEDAYNRFGCFVENQHPAHTSDDDIIKQLYTGLQDVGGFNCLIGPPWRPASAGSKGTTIDSLLNADLDNYIGKNIRVISMVGAAVDPGLQLRERVWEANAMANAEKTIFNERYGASEIGMAASDCQYSDGVHIHQGFVYGEVVDRNGQHVKNGERGLVLFTGLRHGSRYLRYAVGDEATFVDEPCRCGKTAPRLKNIQRVVDMERLKTGCASGGY